MSSRHAFLHPAPRRRWLRWPAWACLWLVLALVAAPWWQQAAARSLGDVPAMAICSVGGGNSGNAPAHVTAGHCPLCCGHQAATPAPSSGWDSAPVSAMSYPLARALPPLRSASLAPGSPQARAPPA
ncbi:DUF2946 family protein [Herbaspirillum rubrisubalbicans]|uniref:DUF2946 domain-containing protein n=1 Tax=Herbaspirillum rubrisubalbicans TaxID=80842 RepID=A0AAD0UAA6_9BURK|nr:DUF2946 family protein [Herbaspirillum rubrisubalbicans]ALU91252.1 hypothetical protein Hrubri_4103 [Herbaspirillum rubrisubalbicans M1]AYR26278.1 hypothetical protein RC54_21740 [Herbaspirillum rubrisubalbicans]